MLIHNTEILLEKTKCLLELRTSSLAPYSASRVNHGGAENLMGNGLLSVGAVQGEDVSRTHMWIIWYVIKIYWISYKYVELNSNICVYIYVYMYIFAYLCWCKHVFSNILMQHNKGDREWGRAEKVAEGEPRVGAHCNICQGNTSIHW